MQIAGGATLVALLLGWYAWTNLETGSSFTYFQTLDEFRAAADQYTGRYARVHGYVALGSIERDVEGRQVRFQVVNDPPHAGGSASFSLPVLYTSLETPDLFKDGAEVVVEGVWSSPNHAGVFHADKVMAKCPSKFEADPTQTAAF
ncbi:MAG: cytochrome c maturation protein CcmE [Myxococcota bacterium]|nr:cytochrome c maturation protein CcmE [Myxococcota bacterium]